MATITIITPDENDEFMYEGFAIASGYAPYIQDPRKGEIIPNPVSKQQFLAECIKLQLISVTAEYMLKVQTQEYLNQIKTDIQAQVKDSVTVDVSTNNSDVPTE